MPRTRKRRKTTPDSKAMASPENLDATTPVLPTGMPTCAATQTLESDTLVTILAGPHEVKQVVHKDLLCATSRFFDAAFNGGFRESATKELKLPEDDPDIIRFLCEWLYAKSSREKWCFKPLQSSWELDTFWLEVYIAADKFFIPDMVVSAFLEIWQLFSVWHPTIPSVTFIDTLYRLDEPPALHCVQAWIAEHFMQWAPDSARERDYRALLQGNDRLAAMVRTAIAYHDQEDRGTPSRYSAPAAAFQEKYRIWVPRFTVRRPYRWSVSLRPLRE
ncbi:uncharacterized protein Z520_04607 [Fonsecaea multimorphosa CBS 102226]|uniref:BTB domain-containing protein n=1 Tax=Fonsecaea multimorphosa CBS 102226 TaxID=1442371 RepID=A0A0D2KA05_9EURO|nr:uncharacterized protein Z520_04607 [Fonsecaea multimorphosa CBS 102226]KIX99969.1 hypothetical protein Z520_04607 [Fonsecaea multimorphosa CBS 102226]